MSDLTAPNENDRVMESIRAIVRTELTTLRLAYAGSYAYSITSVNGAVPSQTIDCDPSDDSLGLPALTGVQLQREIGGITAIPDIGMQCIVTFLNRDPGLPRIVGWGSSGLNPLARVGDEVTLFCPPQIELIGVAVDPFIGYLQFIDQNVKGYITQGSPVGYSG